MIICRRLKYLKTRKADLSLNEIIVTGASGFIGRNLVPQLCGVGYKVISADIESGDVTEDSTWMKFPQAEAVIHLAAKTFVPDSWADPAAYIKCNLLGTVAALNYCIKNNARLILLSSYLYGNPETLPISETAPIVANNPYALSKKLAEEVCRFYSERFDEVNITILRLFNVYGPGQPENFLIPSIIRQVNAGQVIKVKDLEPKRDYVYVGDVTLSIIKSLHGPRKLNIFNIGSGTSYSVKEIIKIIQYLKKTSLPVYSSAERRKDEIMNTVADITLAKRQLDWVPQWTLHQGLKKCLSG